MFPLLLIDTHTNTRTNTDTNTNMVEGEVQIRKKDKDQEHQVIGMVRDVMNEAKELVGAESTCLFIIVDDESSTLPAHYHEKQEESVYRQRFLYHGTFCDEEVAGQPLCLPVERGLVSKAAINGKILNVQGVEGHPDYDPEVSVVQHLHKALGSKINHMVCVPVLDVYGNTIAVIQATNKKKGTADDGFSQDDEQVLQTLATHISVSMQNIYSNTETSVKEVIQLLKISNTPA